MRHLIRRQIINAEIRQKLNAFEVQQRISKFYYDQILQALEKTFDELSTEETVIQFDRLEIDIGEIRVKQLQSGSANDAIRKAVQAQLKKIIAEAVEKKAIRPLPEALTVARQWLFYMEHGFLPWNAGIIDGAWYEMVLETFAVDYQSANDLRRLITTNLFATERIFHQHPLLFLISLVETLTAQKQDRLPACIEEISRALAFARAAGEDGGGQESNRIEKELWMSALQITALSPGSTEAVGMQLIKEKISDSHLQLIRASPKLRSQLPETIQLFDDIYEGRTPAVVSKGQNEDNSLQKRGGDEGEERKSSEPVMEDGIFVVNAGLVLLHHFLNLFFTRIGLVMDGHFIDGDLHQKAIYALHYLATGKVEAGEYELVIEKLLCGFPLNEPVQKKILLTQDDLEESDQLLRAVIEQWSILKNTSPAGLREAFLQRSGKLFSRNDNVHLIVESSSFDVLLDHLPWNLSMIKLPWMDKLVRVEWR